MKLLAIDTSTSIASIALLTAGQIEAVEQPVQRQHAQLILPLIEQLLKNSNTSLSELNGIVFGRGPGSFTGLRIACSVAQGLAYAHNLPLYPVSSLYSIAYPLMLSEEEAIVSMIDARMQQLYWSSYVMQKEISPEQVSDPQSIDILNDRLIVAGVGVASYMDLFLPQFKAKIIACHERYPSAKSMIEMVLRGIVRALPQDEAMPIYIRNQVTHQGGTGG